MPARPSARIVLLAALLLALPLVRARGDVPVLRAHSPELDVRDGGHLRRGAWRASPRETLDVYGVRRFRGERRVTFVSDTDSLSFDVRPGEIHDFIVQLDGRDSCRTRLSTLARGAERRVAGTSGPDTLPITFVRGKIHVRGSVNGSPPLELIFDTGADACVLYPSAVRKGVRVTHDGSIVSSGTGGTAVRRTSSDNALELSGLRWTHVGFIDVERQADAADGIVGYPLFEDRVVELDFGRMVMVVRDSLRGDLAGFHRTPLLDEGSLTAVGAALRGGGLDAIGRFVLDTAGNGALLVNAAFAGAHGLPGRLRRIGSSTSRGVGAGAVRNDVVLLPELAIAGFTLHDVPVDIQQASPSATAAPGGALCVDALRRFDVLLDYPHGEAWFRPNARFDDRFPARRPGARALVLVAIATAVAVALAAARWRPGQTAGNPAA